MFSPCCSVGQPVRVLLKACASIAVKLPSGNSVIAALALTDCGVYVGAISLRSSSKRLSRPVSVVRTPSASWLWITMLAIPPSRIGCVRRRENPQVLRNEREVFTKIKQRTKEKGKPMRRITYIQPRVKYVTDVEEDFMSNLSNFQIGDGDTTPIEDVDPDDIIITTKQDKLWDEEW